MVLLLGVVIFLNGCALLQIPGLLIEGTFGLLKEIIKLVGKLPMPPPGIF